MPYTIVALIFISLILLFWLYKLICHCFFKPFCLWEEQKNNSAPSKEATILSIKTLKARKFPLLEIQIVFENFSGYPVHRNLQFWDRKPHLNRYKKDGKVHIALDPNKKPEEPYFLQSEKPQVSLILILFCSLLTMAYIAGCYFLMGEAISRITLSPEHYESLFSKSSGTTKTFIIISVVLIFLYFLFKRLGLLTTKGFKSQNWDLLYYGLGTLASVKTYEDTGSLINDNPLVKFNYTYQDETGQIFEGSDKKVVDKLEVVGLQDLHELEIMYLPQDPHISRLTENLQEQSFSDLMTTVFIICLFILSLFLVVSFCQDIF